MGEGRERQGRYSVGEERERLKREESESRDMRKSGGRGRQSEKRETVKGERREGKTER